MSDLNVNKWSFWKLYFSRLLVNITKKTLYQKASQKKTLFDIEHKRRKIQHDNPLNMLNTEVLIKF